MIHSLNFRVYWKISAEELTRILAIELLSPCIVLSPCIGMEQRITGH